AAKDKANAASNDKAAMGNHGQYKNETHALKAALLQLSEETGTPMRGWALGHYRKAFRESGSDDMASIRDIFNNRHGIQNTGDSGETPVVPSVDPEDPAVPDVGLAGTTPDGELSSEEQNNLVSGNTGDDTGIVTEDGTGAGVIPGDVPLAEEKTAQDNELFAILDNL
ncbi:hypothetical protein LJC48_07760, partial [Desulfovibrio sp. OttesenSCG-928-C06]|nr:hypothetical protein [Desulfovibrio sp. OttesenSCG-928-C06]